MKYQTMTRNRLIRLIAKGWLLKGQLYMDLYLDDFQYFEIAYVKVDGWALLEGKGYSP